MRTDRELSESHKGIAHLTGVAEPTAHLAHGATFVEALLQIPKRAAGADAAFVP